MGRNVIATMGKIFDVLEQRVDIDDKCRIVKLSRHIKADCEEDSVIRFVDSSKIKIVHFNLFPLMAVDYLDTKYVLIPSNYENIINILDLDLVDTLSLYQGACMLAISEKCMPIKANIKSLDIIEKCLGIDDSNGTLIFMFSEILQLFEDYLLVRIDESRFQLQYSEDFNRLYGILLLSQCTTLPSEASAQLINLLQLLSSRSVAASVINSVEGQLIEYSFFQLYHCLEYLFVLNNGLSISSSHGVPEETAVDIVIKNKLKITEEENLYRVLKDNTPDDILNLLYDSLSESADDIDVSKWVASYIYKIRCHIAHLRYNQDDLLDSIQWKQLIAYSSQIVLSTYQKLDSRITSICETKNFWIPISFTIKGK